MKAAVSAGIVIEIMSGLTLCWSCVVCTGMYWYVLVCTGMYWYVLVCTGMYWYVLVQVRTEFLCII